MVHLHLLEHLSYEQCKYKISVTRFAEKIEHIIDLFTTRRKVVHNDGSSNF